MKNEELQQKVQQAQADRLVGLVTDDNCFLFNDQFGAPYARFLVNESWETAGIRQKAFKRWLGALYWHTENKALSPTVISTALLAIESRACYDGPQIELQNRISRDHEDVIWYDLGDWRAIRISKEGWEVIDKAPTLFRRYSHQKVQVTPTRNGDIGKLLEFLNLKDDHQKLLYVVATVACFIPEIPHPVFVFFGPQGSAKTTASRITRKIVDPSIVEALSFPRNTADLAQILNHNWFASFDNISGLSREQSNDLCRAVTGFSFSKRELYTDDEDVLCSFRRIVSLNGINLVAQKSDLLERSILLELTRITPKQRRSEQELWEEFDEALPSILGGILDILVLAMNAVDDIKLDCYPRMADFAKWGSAIAEVMDHPQGAFLDAYNQNIASQTEEALQSNPVAVTLLTLMEQGVSDEWQGTPSELYEVLTLIAEDEKISTKGRMWPNSPASLTRKLNEAKTNLAEVGIEFRSEKRTAGKRLITITKTAESIATTATDDDKPIGDMTREEVLAEFSGNSGDVNYDPNLPF